MNKFLLLIFPVLLLSCSSREYLEFRHKNVGILSDEVIIRINSKKNKDFVTVKSTYHKTVTESNPYRLISHKKIRHKKNLSKERYTEIVNMLNLVSADDMKYPKTGRTKDGQDYIQVILDGGNNWVYLKNDSLKREWNSYGINKEIHGNFYDAVELIMKAAELDMYYVN